MKTIKPRFKGFLLKIPLFYQYSHKCWDKAVEKNPRKSPALLAVIILLIATSNRATATDIAIADKSKNSCRESFLEAKRWQNRLQKLEADSLQGSERLQKLNQELLKSVKEGEDPQKLHTLIEQGADPQAQNTNDETALMLAVKGGHLALIASLIQHGVPLDTENFKGESAFMLAGKRGEVELIQAFFKTGIKISKEQKTKALVLATQQDHLKAMEFLLQKGADPNGLFVDTKYNPVRTGTTALIEAILNESMPAVKLLFAYGADPNKKVEGDSALIPALFVGNREIFDFLVQKGADWHVKDDKAWTLIMLAVRWDRSEILEFLIQQGLNIFAKNKEGDLAIHITAGYWSKTGAVQSAKVLINHGLDPDIKNQKGQTSLMLALARGQSELVALLLKQGANPNAQDQNGERPLMYATRFFSTSESHTDLLLQYGADINALDKKGQSVLLWLAEKENLIALRYFLNRGANPLIKNHKGLSLLDILQRKKQLKGNSKKEIQEDFDKTIDLVIQKILILRHSP